MMVLYDQDEVVEMYGRSKRREGKMEGAVEMCQGFGMTMKDTISEIAEKFGLSAEDAKSEVKLYWKKASRAH